MKAAKKISGILLKSILFVIGFIALYFLCAFVLGVIPCGGHFSRKDNGIEVFVQSNGVHTDFVLPVRTKIIQWSQFFPYSDFELADNSFSHIAFGWGDKGFYIDTPAWDDLKFSTVFKACFWLSSAAMHVSYRKNAPLCSEKCKRLLLSEAQYRALSIFVINSFHRKNNAFIHICAKGYGLSDCFYEAKGTYSLFHTCNVWTNNGLKLIGIRTPLWAPFDKAILYHLE